MNIEDLANKFLKSKEPNTFIVPVEYLIEFVAFIKEQLKETLEEENNYSQKCPECNGKIIEKMSGIKCSECDHFDCY